MNSLIGVAVTLALLITLLTACKAEPFVALLTSSMAGAFLLGIPADQIPKLIERGIGEMLGPLTMIICLGAMLGGVIADSGAAHRIARTLLARFGRERMSIALSLTGFIVGIPLLYNVGFVLLVPILLTMSREIGVSPIKLGIPMLAGLSIAHGFLPPHPSPAALVVQFHASMGRTLLLGLAVALPTLAIAGPLFARTIANRPMAAPAKTVAIDPSMLPGTGVSFLCALLPVLILVATTIYGGDRPGGVAAFLGNPSIVLLTSLAVAIALLRRRVPMRATSDVMTASVRSIATVLLVIAGAGALRAVLVESGVASEMGAGLASLAMPPLLLGWTVAMLIRIALGSATVAGLTAAGIVAPLAAQTGADPELMVLAIGAGSLMASHVNDSGFWMFKEYFGATIPETFRTWSLMETTVGIVGLISVLILDAVI